MVLIYLRYWRVIAFSLNGNMSQGLFRSCSEIEAEIPKPLSCIFVKTEGGHFNNFRTKSTNRASFSLSEIGDPLARMMGFHEQAWFDNKWFGVDKGCPMLERDYVDGRLEPLVRSKSITRRLCANVVQKIVQDPNEKEDGLEQYMNKWWFLVHRGVVGATEQERHQFNSLRDSLRTESLCKSIKLVDSPPFVYRNGEEIPTVRFPLEMSVLLFTLLPCSYYQLSEDYPFLQHQSVAQPRHIQSRILNTDKAPSREGFLDLFYDSSSNSNEAISHVQLDLLSIVMYQVDTREGESDPFDCQITGLCDADDYHLKPDFVAKLALPTCFDVKIEALFSRFFSSSEKIDDDMKAVVLLGRLFNIIVNQFDAFLSVSGMLRFHSLLQKLFPNEFVAIPTPQCEFDLKWQLGVMLQCLTTLRFGAVDGQQRLFSLILRLLGMTIDPRNPRTEIPLAGISVEALDGFLSKLKTPFTYQIYAPQLGPNNGEYLPSLRLMKRSATTQHLHAKASPTTLADRCVYVCRLA